MPKGEPENPILEEELKSKFVALAAYGHKTPDVCDRIIKSVWNIEETLNDLYALL